MQYLLPTLLRLSPPTKYPFLFHWSQGVHRVNMHPLVLRHITDVYRCLHSLYTWPQKDVCKTTSKQRKIWDFHLRSYSRCIIKILFKPCEIVARVGIASIVTYTPGTELQHPQNGNSYAEHQFPCDYSSEERTLHQYTPHCLGILGQFLVQM